MSKFIFFANMKRVFEPDKALFADVMGLITAKKRNEVWLKKTFILARNIILDMLLGGLQILVSVTCPKIGLHKK